MGLTLKSTKECMTLRENKSFFSPSLWNQSLLGFKLHVIEFTDTAFARLMFLGKECLLQLGNMVLFWSERLSKVVLHMGKEVSIIHF